LHRIEYVESAAPNWSLASNEIIQKLYDANVKAGQVICIDAHSNPAGGPVVFSAHYSKALHGTGPLGITCSAYEGRYAWSEFYIQCARQVVDNALHKEDILGITYSFHSQDRCVSYVFYQDNAAIPVVSLRGQRASLLSIPMEPSIDSILEVGSEMHSDDADRSWFRKVLSMTMCCAGANAKNHVARDRDLSVERPVKRLTSEHKSALVGSRWKWQPPEEGTSQPGLDASDAKPGSETAERFNGAQQANGNVQHDSLAALRNKTAAVLRRGLSRSNFLSPPAPNSEREPPQAELHKSAAVPASRVKYP